MKKGQSLDVEITDIAFGGRGLTKIDGMTVFVDQAVPGDKASIRIFKKKKNYAEARVIRIIEPSADRIRPPCPYSGYCGGCKWQFLKYSKQLEYKRQHVIEALKHIGFIEDVRVHATMPSILTFGYRNKMEFSCSDNRWLLPEELGKEGVDKGFALGLHVPGTFHKVIDTQACLLQPDMGNALLGDARAFMKSSSRPVYGLRSHIGFWRFLMLRHSVARDQWMVNIITSAEDRDAVQPLADLLMHKYPQVASVINNVTARKAGIAIGEFERTLAGDDGISDKIDRFEFNISANSFFQTNTIGAGRLYDVVKQYAQLSGTETVLDLYSGTGTIPIVLSDYAAEIIGLEIVESAVKDAEANCHHNQVSNCRFVLGDIRKMLPSVDTKPDVLVIDPPRAGMHKDVVKQVLAMAPEKIVYVSCNPATLARDLNLLKDTYEVLEVQPVDMFPHTFHIEAVVRMRKVER